MNSKNVAIQNIQWTGVWAQVSQAMFYKVCVLCAQSQGCFGVTPQASAVRNTHIHCGFIHVFFEQPETFLASSTLSCMASSVAMTQLKKLWPKYVKGIEGELEKDLQVFQRYHFWILICQIWALLTCEAEAILRAWLLQSKEPAKQASNWDDGEKGLGCQLWDVADGSVGSAIIAHDVSMEIHISKVHRSVTHSEVATHFPIDSVRCSWKARRILSVFDHIKIRTCVQR